MKISYQWLKAYIQLSESPTVVAQRLTQTGLEVSHITPYVPLPRGLVVGDVLTCIPHPQADRLYKTTVDIGTEVPVQIVCGAPNVAAGQKVVVAPVGTLLSLPEGQTLKIKKTKIRGETSEGMICAEDEIGLGVEHEGIMVLDTPLAPGTPAEVYFALMPDEVLTVDLTPNRTDALGHLGVARDLAAALQRTWSYPEIPEPQQQGEALPMEIRVVDKQACPHYSGIVLRDAQIAPSPQWLQHRLKAIGLQPINNVVDVTNFVMHELGQPLHAFDYNALAGARVSVQFAEAGTKLTTLDGKLRVLTASDLIIADAHGPVALAGVMGGKPSAVTSKTQTIFLESAYFAAPGIGQTAKQHNLHTDAAFRYERGTDPNGVIQALYRACALLQQVAHATVASKLLSHCPNPTISTRVPMRYANIKRLIGHEIPRDTVYRILAALDIEIQAADELGFVAVIPTYRVDVQREADVIEEILRIYGYDQVPAAPQLGSTYLAPIVLDAPHHTARATSTQLAAQGYTEVMNNSLVSHKQLLQLLGESTTPTWVHVANPLSELLDTLRPTLLLGGLHNLQYNAKRGQTNLKLFELGTVYKKAQDAYHEATQLALWCMGATNNPHWSSQAVPLGLRDLKQIVYQVLWQLGLHDVSESIHEASHYAQAISLQQGKHLLGTLGSLTPAIQQRMELPRTVFFAQLHWETLLALRPQGQSKIQPPPKFPAVYRDLSLILPLSVTFSQAQAVHTSMNLPLLREVALVDVYYGDLTAKGTKTYTLRFCLQAPNRTLRDREIDSLMERLMQAYAEQLQAVINR